MAGRGQKLAAALQRKKEAEQARAQTPVSGSTGQPPIPPIPGSRQISRAPTPSVPSENLGRPPLPVSRPGSRTQTPGLQGAMAPPPLPASKAPSGRQTPATVSGGVIPTASNVRVKNLIVY